MISSSMQTKPNRITVRLALSAFALILTGTLSACSDTADVVSGPTPVNALFQSYVAMGNSITAGYQSGGINDSTQQESYALLLAQQMHTRYAYPSLVRPGCAPPVINFLTQAREGGGTASTCALRSASSVTDALNNVAVPGATSLDPFSTSTSASNALTTFILGGKTQADRASDARPTFVSLWIGNNDVLAAAVSGLLVPTAGISPGITPLATFQQNIDATMTRLLANPTLKGGVIIGVVQVAAAPVLFPAAALQNPTFKAGLDAAAGQTITIHPSCNSAPGLSSLISFSIIGQIRAGTHPALIACTPVTTNPPVGDIFVLDATEQATLTARVTDYNNYLQSVATTNGWAYWDPNPALVTLKSSGCISTVPNIGSATQPFGACVSLDGVHPTGMTHKIVANSLIGVINAKYQTSLAVVP